MRLIDADEAHKKLTDLYKYAKREARRAYSVAIDIVSDADTIEAEPAHGRWIWAKDGYLRCSECTQKAPTTPQYQDEPETTATPYCPWCGKKMEMGGGAENG